MTQHTRADPGRAAVVDGGRSLSYGELLAAAAALSSTLRNTCGGRPVAIRLRRGAGLVTALLAATATGVPFLAVDPEAPAEYTRTALTGAGVRALVTEGPVPAELADFATVSPDSGPGAPAPALSGRGPAGYLVRTSGSTGTPKLVEVSGSSLERHARTMSEVYGIEPQDRVLQLANPAFDVLIEEVFPTLVAGATVVTAPHPMPAPSELTEFLAHHGVTVLNLPTPYWREWVAELDCGGRRVPDTVRLVVIGSDMGDWDTVRRWRGHSMARLMNAYGASETTVTCAVWEHTRGEERSGALPVGRPLPGVTAFVLTGDGSEATAPDTGELHIGGWCLAERYVDDAERTGAAFVAHPSDPSLRLYRTRDRARRDADGVITVLGRIDDEVNIRGHRVNPSEASAALLRLDGVSAAHALVHRDGRGEDRLTAYAVVTTCQAGPALRERLRGLLPGHLLPSEVVVLDALPLTTNGKVDETMLPRPQELPPTPAVVSATATDPTALTTVAGLADHIAGLWSAELGRAVGVDDNVFDLGAHSLMLAGVRRRLSAHLGREVPSIALFTHITPQALGRFLCGGEGAAEPAAPQPAAPNRLRARRASGGKR
ncbi:non-ribosomal peptide synthetase [Streptomyces sp. NPDC018347]|uniref:non-ribosomal peptide synthetase n=1 Tax=Streptomyces sp. NPDC018347 TaxID=3157193 RepID=UPI00340D17B8